MPLREAKSCFQWLCGDEEGARVTWERPGDPKGVESMPFRSDLHRLSLMLGGFWPLFAEF